jgi:hypothetical protein
VQRRYPPLKRPDRYTILLTGGSVAAQLVQLDPWRAPRYLEEELNNEYESPNGQPFWVLNGGEGAWIQPQPFIQFALNAQALDAVITPGGMTNRAMEAVTRDYDVKRAYFFQPVPAYGKSLTAAEQAVVGDLSYIGRVAANIAFAWGLKRKQPTTRGLESSR